MVNYRAKHDPYPQLALNKPADPTKVLAASHNGTTQFKSYEAVYYNFMCSLIAFDAAGVNPGITVRDLDRLGSSSLCHSPLCDRIISCLRVGVMPDPMDYLVFTMCTIDGQISPTMQPVDFSTVCVAQDLASLVAPYLDYGTPQQIEFFLNFSARSFCGAYNLILDATAPQLNLRTFVPSSACIEDPVSREFISLGTHWTAQGIFPTAPIIPRLHNTRGVPRFPDYTGHHHVFTLITLEGLMQQQGIQRVPGAKRIRKPSGGRSTGGRSAPVTPDSLVSESPVAVVDEESWENIQNQLARPDPPINFGLNIVTHWAH